MRTDERLVFEPILLPQARFYAELDGINQAGEVIGAQDPQRCCARARSRGIEFPPCHHITQTFFETTSKHRIPPF